VIVSDVNIFTEGLYTVDQAARLAQVSPQLLRNWLDGTTTRDPAVFRRIPENDAEVVGFIDLIQTLAIRAIRTSRKLSLQKIRSTIIAARDLGIEYPFARKHQTFLFSDDVVIRVGNPPEERLIQVTGKYKNQHLLRPVTEPYLVDLSYDSNGLASEYSPLSDGDSKIVINPKKQYGAPIVVPSGYTVEALVNAYEGEGSLRGAADAFGITETEVKLAVRYDNFLSGIAA
jgi:uncharacterized protein (DUF433 family)